MHCTNICVISNDTYDPSRTVDALSLNMASAYHMETDLQVAALNTSICTTAKQAKQATTIDSESNQPDTESAAKRIKSDVLYQSDLQECLSYEMPLTSIPTPILWNTVDVSMPTTLFYPDNPAKMIFQFPPIDSLLTNLILSITLPSVVVKKEFSDKQIRLRWDRDLQNLVVKRAELRVGSVLIESMDSTKMHFAAFLSNTNHFLGSSSDDDDEGPPIHLESFTLHASQPWHYSQFNNRGYPMFSVPVGHTLDHIYYFDIDPLNLVSAQIYDEADDTVYVLNSSDIHRMLEAEHAITVQAIAETVAILPVERENLKDLMSEQQKSVMVVEECPTVGVFYTERCDTLLWTLAIPARRIVRLCWGAKDMIAERKYNARNMYGAGFTRTGHSKSVVKESALVMSQLEITHYKFRLYSHVTRCILPGILGKDMQRHPGGMHMYTFAKFISTGSTTSDYEQLSSSLMVYMKSGSVTSGPSVWKCLSCTDSETEAEAEAEAETEAEAEAEATVQGSIAAALAIAAAAAAAAAREHETNASAYEQPIFSVVDEVKESKIMQTVGRVIDFDPERSRVSRPQDLPHRIISYATVIKAYCRVKIGNTDEFAITLG